MNDPTSIHYTQWVIMAIGVMFVLFGAVIVKYNFHRKAERFNHKMPSGNIFAATLIILGLGVTGYGYVHEPPKLSPKELLLSSKSVSESDLTGESSSEEDEDGGQAGFLSAVSSSAK
jgi:hypothetical protein